MDDGEAEGGLNALPLLVKAEWMESPPPPLPLNPPMRAGMGIGRCTTPVDIGGAKEKEEAGGKVEEREEDEGEEEEEKEGWRGAKGMTGRGAVVGGRGLREEGREVAGEWVNSEEAEDGTGRWSGVGRSITASPHSTSAQRSSTAAQQHNRPHATSQQRIRYSTNRCRNPHSGLRVDSNCGARQWKGR